MGGLDPHAAVVHEYGSRDPIAMSSKLETLVSQLEGYGGGSSDEFNAHLRSLCGSDPSSRAIVTLVCSTSASNVDGVLGFKKDGLRERLVEALEKAATGEQGASFCLRIQRQLLPMSSASLSNSGSGMLGDAMRVALGDDDDFSGYASASVASNDGEILELEGKMQTFFQSSAPPQPQGPISEAQNETTEPATLVKVSSPVTVTVTGNVATNHARPSTAPASSSTERETLDAFAEAFAADNRAQPRKATSRDGARSTRGRQGKSGNSMLLGGYDLRAQVSRKQQSSPSPSPAGAGGTLPSYMMPRTSLGMDKAAGRVRSAGSLRASRKTPVPSYMLPIGKTRFASPEPNPAVSTREVDALFRETNLFMDVPQEDENRRLLDLLRQKAEDARGLISDADLMWRGRLSASLDVSMGALKRKHDEEIKEVKVGYQGYKPNERLLEAVSENKFLVPPILAKTISPSKEHRDYLLRHLKAQEEHNITRFLVKRSGLLIRQAEQRQKMRNSLGGAYSRLDRIRETQQETIGAIVSRVEHKVAHTDRLHNAVQPLISAQPKIQSKRATLEALEAIRHGLRLMADLASKIPDLYESVCIADGPIENSLPTTDFSPLTPNFYPRSVVHGRSKEDLVKELSSFLPYSDRSHLRSRSPSRERSRERSQSPGLMGGGGLPPVSDLRPNSAPAGIFVSSPTSNNNNKASAGGQGQRGREELRRVKSASARRSDTSSPEKQQQQVLWGGEGFADDTNDDNPFSERVQGGQGEGLPATFGAVATLSPLDFYRLTLEAKRVKAKVNKGADAKRLASAKKQKDLRAATATWQDYLDQDQRCPWCLELFQGQGECDSSDFLFISSLYQFTDELTD